MHEPTIFGGTLTKTLETAKTETAPAFISTPTDPAVLKLLEQGGIIALLLVLSLFFWVLTQFVSAIKKE